MNAARKVPTTLFGEKSSPSKVFNLVPPRFCAYDTNSPVYGGFIPRTTGIVFFADNHVWATTYSGSFSPDARSGGDFPSMSHGTRE